MSHANFKSFICIVCGFVYSEEAGRPEDGITPGTKWADVPEDWACPVSYTHLTLPTICSV